MSRQEADRYDNLLARFDSGLFCRGLFGWYMSESYGVKLEVSNA